jgi:2,5-diamino-6-(ribosylamino)-4(3H)-pyrimidinone 5'-phosphate reductase
VIKSTKRPRVIANFALTADGKVSTRNLTPTGFTSKRDKRGLLEIRSLGDAVLAGARTVKTDQMSMRITADDLRKRRSALGKPPEPLRVIVTNRGAIDISWKVFQTPGAPILVFSGARMSQAVRASIAQHADLWIFDTPEVDLAAMLQILRSDYQVRTVVCEGGPRLFRKLLEIGAVDELHLTWTPLIFGGAKAPTLIGVPDKFLPATIRCRLKKMRVEGDECFLTYSL